MKITTFSDPSLALGNIMLVLPSLDLFAIE